MLKLLIRLQSFSDVITNSSSEIFCQIKSISSSGINAIAEYLNTILPCEVSPSMRYDDEEDSEEDGHTIDFWIEQGSDAEHIGDNFAALLEHVLLQHFNEDSFEILTDVDY